MKKTLGIIKRENIKKYEGMLYFLIIIICWIPTLLAFYPIMCNYDGIWQVRAYLSGVVSTRHPIIHTYLLSNFYLFGLRYLKSPALGMLMFSIFQMTINAGIFAYSVRIIEKETEKKWLRNIVLMFYAIFPFNPIFSISTTKDVLFAGITLLFIIKKIQALNGKNNLKDYIFLILIGVLMLLFRNNAMYAIIFSIPFIVLIMRKDKEKLAKIILITIIIVFGYKLINIGLIILTNAGIDSNQEKLSVFSQATAKIVKENMDDLTEEEKQKITFFFKDYKKMGDVYESNIADNTKAMSNCKNIDNNKVEFIRLMIHFFRKYPRQFTDSFLNTIRGYWYICDNSFNQIDHENQPDKKGILELTVENVMPGKFHVEEHSYIPWLQNSYRAMFCKNYYRNIPIIYIVFQPATYFYIVLAYLLYSIYVRRKDLLIIAVYLFSYFVTCFLGPVALVRYIYVIIVSIPFIIGILLKQDNRRE